MAVTRPRRSRGSGRRRRVGRGKVWDWIKGAAGKVNKFLKDTKIISKVAPAIAGAVPGMGGKVASMIGSAASQAGYGRRRRRRTGKMPAALAAYWAKKRGGSRRRRTGRGMPVSFGVTPASTYPHQTPYARVRM